LEEVRPTSNGIPKVREANKDEAQEQMCWKISTAQH